MNLMPIKTMTNKKIYINPECISEIEEVSKDQICIIMTNKEFHNVQISFTDFKKLLYNYYK